MSVAKIRSWAFPHIKNWRTYIDVGAHDGDTSAPFVDQFEKVVIFEPNPHTFLMNLHSKIEKHNCALGSVAGQAKLKIPEITNRPDHGSIADRRNKDWNGLRFDVEVRTLDSFNYDDVDFIKIDVEQGEQEVIEGALATIKRCHPVIMFENKRNENDHIITLLEKDYQYRCIKYYSDTVATPS
jgi:FkbM family methyltransferase